MLKHYSSNWITPLEEREYEQDIDDKPHGLWVDASSPGELSWKEYAMEYGIRLFHDVSAAYEIELFDSSNILELSSESNLADFTDEYGVRYEMRYGQLIMPQHDIDWRIVAHEYQGIIIAPYQIRAKEQYPWYRSWDIASGCIWDLDAIQKIECI